jgi:hypothetical protein
MKSNTGCGAELTGLMISLSWNPRGRCRQARERPHLEQPTAMLAAGSVELLYGRLMTTAPPPPWLA